MSNEKEDRMRQLIETMKTEKEEKDKAKTTSSASQVWLAKTMNKNNVTLAFVGAVIAVLVAFGISKIFIGFATETYTSAIERAGGYPTLDAAGELASILSKIKDRGGLRGYMAQSLLNNRGLVYTPKRECDRTCEGYGCVWAKCGVLIIYADDFSHISYKNGVVKLPPPKISLWIYTVIAGAIMGIIAGLENDWGKFLFFGTIIVILLWLLITPQLPATTTILLSGVAGGVGVFLLLNIPLPEPR